MKNLIIPNTNSKARNVIQGNLNTLFSYDTEIATYNEETQQITVKGYYSATTGRHINEFFKLFGLPMQTKKELFKNFNLTK